MKRWVFIFSLLLLMVPMPALARNDVDVEVDRKDQELNFPGDAGEEEVFIDSLELTATGGDVDRFRFTVNDLKSDDGSGEEIPRTRVKFIGDRTLREGVPKVFTVIIRGVVEEPGTYEGKAEIIPIGQSEFKKKQIDLTLKADPNPSLSTVAQIVFILFLLGAIVFLAWKVIQAGVDRGSMPEDKRSWLDYGNFYVVTWGIVAVILGFVGILLFVDRFEDLTQALGFLTAFFGAIVGLVGTFFGVKQSADAAAGAQRGQREAAANGANTTPPQVRSTDPPDRAENVPPGTPVTATFSRDMNRDTINTTTFNLLKQEGLAPVVGRVEYDVGNRRATFIPETRLVSGEQYEATITASVKDSAGNTLAQNHTWHFTVTP